MITFMCEMCKKYEHMIAVTNRFLVEGDFLMQLEKAHYLGVNERSRSDCVHKQVAKRIANGRFTGRKC